MSQSINSKGLDKDSIKLVNRVLQFVLYGALMISLSFVVAPLLMNGLELSLDSDQGEILVKPETLAYSHRVIFSLLYSLSLFCWIFGLFWLLKLSRRFSTGEIFSKRNTDCIKIFAYSLLLMAIVEPIHEVLAAHFLISTGYIDGTVEVEFLSILSQMDYIVSAMAILLICAVFNKAVDLSEESKFTI